jgi:ADP-heptose:LPS heptosyltransferase
VLKARFLKQLDLCVGRLALRILTKPLPVSVTPPKGILIIRPGGIGDAALLAPAIGALQAAFNRAAIDVLAESRNAAVFALCPTVRQVFCYDRPSAMLNALRSRYDLVIDTEQWHRLSAVVARLTRSPLLIGFATNERSRLFTHPVGYFHNDYEADSFFHLLAPLGITTTPAIALPFLRVPEKSAKKGRELLGSLAEQAFVAIFPGASIAERRWGTGRFRMVAERLHAQGIPVVVIGGKEDAADGELIIAGKYGLNLAGKTSLVETAAVIEKAALLLSGDSGILHIGVGLGRPTVSLFGPGIAKKWAPRGPRHIVINNNLPCSPCTKFGYTPKCPINAKCLADITVDEVVTAAEKLLGHNRE